MKVFIAAILAAVLIIGCGGAKKVTRLDSNTVTDLSGKWNDTDSRLVSEEMIGDCMSRAWIINFLENKGHKPVVTVGTVRNLSDEHINTETFTIDMERELINSGQVRFVASRDQRGEIRDERAEQQEYASDETVKKMREETGADFLIQGSIKTILDQAEGIKVVFYQTDLEMINVESNEKVWIGTKKIKKEISRNKTKW
ncbi:MAG: penicillin-binding protein activator LpoB [candidate division Zixibacteria bacterium]